MGCTTTSGARVLVVDDEPANVALLERLLEGAGVGEIVGVTDPREAVARCLEAPTDLVLLDLHMPHLDGFAVLAALRDAQPDGDYLPVLVLTADVTTRARDQALQLGANDFLTKPLDRTEVVLRVRNLLRTRDLHVDVQRRNAALEAELAERAQAELAREEQRRRRLALIEQALRRGDPDMAFQPVTDLRADRVVGVEALARFRHPVRRSPDRWFAEAAAVGRGHDLELVAVRHALARLAVLDGETFLAVNVSPETARTSDFARLLQSVPAERVVVELTEHTRIDAIDDFVAAVAPLRERGIRLAVDDAGSGYAGLRQILSLRPDIVKLDMELTRGVDQDPARRALTVAMVGFAEEIGATLIAEGVETAAELATLRALGVPWAQGFQLAPPAALPLPAAAAATLVARPGH